jgi:NADH:ubiquinone oxidoreductase subunit 5 (subunit L)/multisubunit Na+/H+ antiporter MnhA subunit
MSAAQILLGAAVVTPVLAAGVARVSRGSGGTLIAAPAIAAFGLAVALLVVVALGGPVSLVAETPAGRAVAGLTADRVSALLLVLVTGVLAIVHAYATRYLSGDPRAPRFFAISSLTAAATGAAICAATFSGFVAAWCLAGLGLCRLLAHRPDLAEARAGVRRTAYALAVGDGALLVALLLVLLSGPDIDLRSPDLGGLATQGLTGPVAALIGLCALARSAQFPLHRWLPGTLSAPTPVSALLHAGLINGAGLLMIRLAPFLEPAPAVLWALLAAGLATAVLATAFMLVRPDVKSGLAWSTGGQMGFMVAQCATGAFAAALFHLICHALYKATLFLGSGGAVDARARRLRAPLPRPLLAPAPRAAVAAIGPALMVGGAVAALAPHLTAHAGAPLLLAFAWASAAHAAWGWLGAAGGLSLRARIAGAGALAAGCWAYVAAVAAFDGFTGGSLPEAAAAAPPPWVILAAIGAAAAAWGLIRLAGPRVAATERRVYALLWSRSAPGAAPGPSRRLRARRRREPAFIPEPRLGAAAS